MTEKAKKIHIEMNLVPQVVFDEASAKVFFNPFYPNITRMSKNTLPHSFLSTERLSLSQ